MKDSVKKVIKLRKEGKTYKEIKRETGLAKGTISYICRKYVPDNSFIHRQNDKAAKDKIPPEQMAAMRAGADDYYKKLRLESKNKWAETLQKLESSEIYYMAGLYDGEGNHKGTGFDISNSDPKIINFITEFLDKISANYTLDLCIHTTHNKEECVNFWKLPFLAIRQHDARKQKRNYSATENYGTVYLRVIKPLGLRDALREFSLTQRPPASVKRS